MNYSTKLLLTLSTAACLATLSCAPPTVSTASSGSGATVPAPVINTARVPVGRPDPQGRSNMVISPYRPYNIIDVKGYRSGDVVGDPSTAKLNPSTGKLDSRTAKLFRVP